MGRLDVWIFAGMRGGEVGGRPRRICRRRAWRVVPLGLFGRRGKVNGGARVLWIPASYWGIWRSGKSPRVEDGSHVCCLESDVDGSWWWSPEGLRQRGSSKAARWRAGTGQAPTAKDVGNLAEKWRGRDLSNVEQRQGTWRSPLYLFSGEGKPNRKKKAHVFTASRATSTTEKSSSKLAQKKWVETTRLFLASKQNSICGALVNAPHVSSWLCHGMNRFAVLCQDSPWTSPPPFVI